MSNQQLPKIFYPEKPQKRRMPQSVLLFKCKQCKLPHEVKANQSQEYCEYCRPIARCLHGIKVSIPCEKCLKVHPGGVFRMMPH